MTTPSEKQAARGILLNGLLALPFGALFFLVGTGLFVFYQAHPDLLDLGLQNDGILPLFVSQNFPIGLAGLMDAEVFAASMSSLDSSMHSVATAWTTD